MAKRSHNNSQTKTSLANDIWSACDILRRDNNCGGIMEYIEHLAWLLFLKFLDDQEDEWKTQAQIDKRTYHRILEDKFRWNDWAQKDWPADDLIRFVNGDLIPYLRNLQGDPMRDTIRGVFTDRNVIVCASGYNLKDVLLILDKIDFHNKDDVFTVSQVYEDLLKRLGNENRMAGEFYTPRPVVRFIVDVIDPKIRETVYDPACGSCGFLAQSYERMKKKEKTVQDNEILQQKTFFGQEKKAVPALLGTLNLVLHGVTAPKVHRRNTLEENIRQVTERYDVVLTNPPFGGTEGKHIQENFPVRSNATELLFVEHIMKKLKAIDGARCGMVVPEGTLFRGGAFATVKKDLLENFNLFFTVSLPPGTFAPYADVKAALIFFQRPGPTKEVLYYELPLPEGLHKFSKGSPVADEHFNEAREAWKQWEDYREGKGTKPETTDNSWVEAVETLAERGYDLSAKNPNRPEAEHLPHPAEITATLLERNRELQSILKDLQSLFSNVDKV
jgi:type I restriction enzyme M protein